MMKKLFILLMLFFVAGCSTYPPYEGYVNDGKMLLPSKDMTPYYSNDLEFGFVN